MHKHHSTIKKYKSSCYIVDYGYEGISKNSRLLQIADFVAYFSNMKQNLFRNETLLNKADDARKIECVDNVCDCLKKKLKLLK